MQRCFLKGLVGASIRFLIAEDRLKKEEDMGVE
jgi:hypothetical protein